MNYTRLEYLILDDWTISDIEKVAKTANISIDDAVDQLYNQTMDTRVEKARLDESKAQTIQPMPDIESEVAEVPHSFKKPKISESAPKWLKVTTWLAWALSGVGTLVMQIINQLDLLSV